MRAELGPSPASADDAASASAGPGRSLLARLDTVRRFLVRTALMLAIGFLVAFAFISRIVEFVLRPLQEALPRGDRLVYLQATDAFILYLTISAIAGALLAAPYILWQLWRLTRPVVSPRLRRLAVACLLAATLLFVAGAAFAHYVVFPFVWRFLAGFATGYMRFAPEIGPTFWLYAKILIAMGVTFQLPVVVFFLARAGLVTHRTLIRHGRYAILAAFVIGAIVTPPDFVSQVLLAAPLMGLYGVAVGIAWLSAPRPDREA
jgi:sec-independent protein translocase protein TatC